MANKNKILVIRGGAIGDFILTLPVFSALKEQFPKSQIDVLGYAHIAELALLSGHVDQVHSIEARGLAGYFAKNGDLDKKLKDLFNTYGLIISYLYDPQEIFKTNVAKISDAQFIIGPHRPDDSGHVHATEVFLDPLKALAIFEPDIRPKISGDLLPVAPIEIKKTDRQFLLAIHPGSGSEKKNWPEENWVTLIKNLIAETDIKFLLVGGESERERYINISRIIPSDRKYESYSLPLSELASCLSKADGFLGHDSGVSHLAAAVGIEGIVLWPHTNPRVWAPRSEKMRLVYNESGIAYITVMEVFDRILKFFINKQNS